MNTPNAPGGPHADLVQLIRHPSIIPWNWACAPALVLRYLYTWKSMLVPEAFDISKDGNLFCKPLVSTAASNRNILPIAKAKCFAQSHVFPIMIQSSFNKIPTTWNMHASRRYSIQTSFARGAACPQLLIADPVLKQLCSP